MRKTSNHITAYVWLLEIWSYEMFPHISVPERALGLDDYPVAEGRIYCQREGTNKKRRKSDPHHNLEFYQGEFDGIAIMMLCGGHMSYLMMF